MNLRPGNIGDPELGGGGRQRERERERARININVSHICIYANM